MIRTTGLNLRIAKRELVTALDWEARPGECWCVIGRNGVGKSTFLHTLAGLRSADGGRIAIREKPLAEWSLPALARERAYLPQGRHDAFGYTVIETVLAARHAHSVTGDNRYWESDADQQAAFAALAAMQLDNFAERDIRSLSGGERQRVAMATVLAQDTPLLLLDEPANALDLAHQVGAMQLLARLCKEARKTVIMVSHDLNLSHQVATHALLLMGDGRWHAGSADDMFQAAFLSACLGHPIEVIDHAGRRIYLPRGEGHHE